MRQTIRDLAAPLVAAGNALAEHFPAEHSARAAWEFQVKRIAPNPSLMRARQRRDRPADMAALAAVIGESYSSAEYKPPQGSYRRRAKDENIPFIAYGPNGVYSNRARLPEAMRGWGKSYLEGMLSDLIKAGHLVKDDRGFLRTP